VPDIIRRSLLVLKDTVSVFTMEDICLEVFKHDVLINSTCSDMQMSLS
jgi:hypothetical protein